MDVMLSREESNLAQFCDILDKMHEGVIIKTAKDNKILFANAMASSILNIEQTTEETLTTEAMPGDDLNIKRFTAIDLKEDKNPFIDDEENEQQEQ